jgi:protein tyrosine/serine phosphatase
MATMSRAHSSPLRLLCYLLLTAVVVVGGWQLYDIKVRHRLDTVTPAKIYKSGAMPPEQMAEVARDLGLKTVIDLRTFVDGQDSTNTTPLGDIEAEAKALEAIGVRHVHLPSAQVPNQETVDSFLRVLDDPANQPALIHCYHGVGRAELFSAVYRMEYEGWSNERARDATRFIVFGSSVDDSKEKGRYLLDYVPRAAKASDAAAPR